MAIELPTLFPSIIAGPEVVEGRDSRAAVFLRLSFLHRLYEHIRKTGADTPESRCYW